MNSDVLIDFIDDLLSANNSKDYFDVLCVVVGLLSAIESNRFSGASYSREFNINGTKLRISYEPTCK